MTVQSLRGRGAITMDQKVSDDIRIDDEHLLVAAPRDRRFDFLHRDRAASQPDRLGCLW